MLKKVILSKLLCKERINENTINRYNDTDSKI